ncbi:hypothetical protein CO173_04705 [Candidatus Uhrbacteria bacterium CG_4_9_14_3_um_filter_41_35]|uniref:Uncharacterized protein n=1 Tax=Candidatus Uhrbacteria bacterium CG_4_9_14_3_um_filter_41_35 TaxID=1975034 RepID=A0A2M7XCY1_9BACT|nr:MAG: hypothetical protein CO173_04705 [Candidatus Uhrbacteria bacterium CG_4_9_14_3_um_filter_41_35]
MTRILKGCLLATALFFSACANDADFDGVPAAQDCNDANGQIRPGAPETCDAVDNDCDGWIDEGLNCPGVGTDTATDAACEAKWALDADGDGYTLEGSETCVSGLAGYVLVSAEADCDDRNPDVNPAGVEVECDGIDNDCNQSIDDNAVEAPVWLLDADGDGYGDVAKSKKSCAQPAGYVVATEIDCNDANPIVHPGATEICDNVDTDCDGITDDDESTDAVTLYADGDGDGFGWSGHSRVTKCDPKSVGYSADNTDCDDLEASVNPGADEVCDLIDNDCDGKIDDLDPSVTDQELWYADGDHDGYGNKRGTKHACFVPRDYVADNTDCNDDFASAKPGAVETCDDIDNDCDGLVDEAGATGELQWYPDNDYDSYGTAIGVVTACNRPIVGHYMAQSDVNHASDCNDRNETVNPGALEQCDLIDHNCDGNAGGTTEPFYRDQDGDGYGNSADVVNNCAQPSGYVKLSTDCNDNVASVHPGATEICDGIDNNCNGQVDTDAVQTSWYADADGDGYGAKTGAISSCTQPSGRVQDNNDCNDAVVTVHPGATEVCDDAVDNNCNGQTDAGDAQCGGQEPVVTGRVCDPTVTGSCTMQITCSAGNTPSTMRVCVSGKARSSVVPGSENAPGADTSTGSLLREDGNFMTKYFVLFYDRYSSGFGVGVDTSRPIYTTTTNQYCAELPRGDWFPALEGQTGTLVVEADLNLEKVEISSGSELCQINTTGVGGASGFVTYVGQ